MGNSKVSEAPRCSGAIETPSTAATRPQAARQIIHRSVTVEQALGNAKLLQKSGKLDQAATIYGAILKANPAHAEALILLGLLHDQQGEHEKAIALLQQAAAMRPDDAFIQENLGAAFSRCGRWADAVAHYDHVIARQSGNAKPHNNRGVALRELGRLEEATAGFERAVELKPDYIDAHLNRGNALRELKRFGEALLSYDRAVELGLDNPVVHNNRGIVLKGLGRFDEAIASYDRAIALRPDYAASHNNRGVALRALGRYEEALESYDRAVEFKADYADAVTNRANTLRELNRFEEALAYCDRAINMQPDHADAHNNRGIALHGLRRFDESIESYQEAISLRPDLASAHVNLALCQLIIGDFERGFRGYERRWKNDDFPSPRRNFSQPLWLGREDISGRTILLHAEQGLGDTIQFCRYAALVADTGARVALEVHAPLKFLLADLKGIDRIVAKGEALPDFDVHCPLLSLPLAFETRLDTIPAAVPYITPSPSAAAAWDEMLGPRTGPRVGLVWSGNAIFKNDHNRTIGLAALRPLLKPDISFVSLQKDIRDDDRLVLEELAMIRHFGDDLLDFSDTAALTSLMDLVISVDTSVAHLAGAMGVPTWVLLPEIPDWRWLLNRDDSPWYPSVRLFRQRTQGDWAPVIDDIAQALTTVFPTTNPIHRG